jgi:hypothetical protein
MLTPARQILLAALLLMVAGTGLALYKNTVLGFPLWPGEQREVWTIESKISFRPTGGPIEVSLRLPGELAGWRQLDEYYASSGFGFSIMDHGGQREALWTRQSLDQPTTLYYKLQVHRPDPQSLAAGLRPPPPARRNMSRDREAATVRVVEQLRELSADDNSFTALLLQQLSQKGLSQDAAFLFGDRDSDPVDMVLDILGAAGIPAQLIRGLVLEDGRKRSTLAELLEIHDGEQWQVFDPDTGQAGLPGNFFVWQRGGSAILDVLGGRKSRIEFALVRNTLPVKSVLALEQLADDAPLIAFSIYTLPVEQQGMFKGILLLPVGALVVVILRVLVGIRTAGTFMPILIALTFMQTTLFIGVLIFLLVVGAGLWIRSWLSHLHLLLVARITAVVIVVIGLMATLSVVSYKLGYEQALSVAFFPTIILAWTVERMSILWEEEGWHEVLVQVGGSLVAAMLAYSLMTNRFIEHLTFNFPELLLCLLGIVLLLGQYSGYRLSELYRFREMEQDP